MVSKFHCIGFTQRIVFVKLSFFKTQCQTVSQFRVYLGNSFCTWVSFRQQFLILKTYVGNSFQYAGSTQEKVSLCIWILTQKHSNLQIVSQLWVYFSKQLLASTDKEAEACPNISIYIYIVISTHMYTHTYICIYLYSIPKKLYVHSLTIC